MLIRSGAAVVCVSVLAACASETEEVVQPIISFGERQSLTYHFSATPLGETKSAYVRITNPSSSPLTLEGLTLTAAESIIFTAVNAPENVAIAARSHHDIELLFLPIEVGTYHATLDFRFTEAAPIQVSLSGEGIALNTSGLAVDIDETPGGDIFVFPPTRIPSLQSAVLTLRNEGAGPLNMGVNPISLTPPDVGFNVGGLLDNLLMPNEPIHIPLTLETTQCGYYESTLRVRAVGQYGVHTDLRGALLAAVQTPIAHQSSSLSVRTLEKGYQVLVGQPLDNGGAVESARYDGCAYLDVHSLTHTRLGLNGSLFGTHLLGSPRESLLLVTAPSGKGRAYFLSPRSTHDWVYQNELLTTENGQALGHSGTWSQDGTTIVLGYQNTDPSAAGSLLLYERGSSWKGLPEASLKFVPSHADGNLSFGQSIASSNTGSVIVTSSHCPTGQEGCVSVWERQAGTWGLVSPQGEPHHRLETKTLPHLSWAQSGPALVATNAAGTFIAHGLVGHSELALHQIKGDSWARSTALPTALSLDGPLTSLTFAPNEAILYVGTESSTTAYELTPDQLRPLAITLKTWPLGAHTLTPSSDGLMLMGLSAEGLWIEPL